jgi:hypothetical protein
MLTKLQYYRTVDCKEVKSAAEARTSCKILCIRFSLIICLLEPQSANSDSCMYISLMVVAAQKASGGNEECRGTPQNLLHSASITSMWKNRFRRCFSHQIQQTLEDSRLAITGLVDLTSHENAGGFVPSASIGVVDYFHLPHSRRSCLQCRIQTCHPAILSGGRSWVSPKHAQASPRETLQYRQGVGYQYIP